MTDAEIRYVIACKRGNAYQDQVNMLREVLQEMIDSYEHEASMNNPVLLRAREVMEKTIEWR